MFGGVDSVNSQLGRGVMRRCRQAHIFPARGHQASHVRISDLPDIGGDVTGIPTPRPAIHLWKTRRPGSRWSRPQPSRPAGGGAQPSSAVKRVVLEVNGRRAYAPLGQVASSSAMKRSRSTL